MDEATYRRMLVEKADISESDSEVEEDEIEDYLDGCSSPDQRTSKYWSPAYQARREARKEVQQARRHARRNLRRHAMSPPATPPHAQGLKQTTTANHAIPMLDLSQKSKRKSVVRKAPRRPTTRSQGSDKVALLPEKGMVRCWVWWMRWSYVDMSYETYLRDFNSEQILAEYPEETKLGANWVCPTSKRHADFQRKQRLRVQKQNETLRNKVELLKEPNGFI